MYKCFTGVTILGWNYEKMESTYPFANYCPCGGYYKIDPSKAIINTVPPLIPVKCQICEKEIHINLKDKNVSKTAPV
jgi:hypothetical protein